MISGRNMMAQNNVQYQNYDWAQEHMDEEEVCLLATIQVNSQLPEKEQQRYQELWQKCEYGTLTEIELAEYQTLVNKLDTRNLKRLEAIIALAELRGKTIDEIIAEVGVKR